MHDFRWPEVAPDPLIAAGPALLGDFEEGDVKIRPVDHRQRGRQAGIVLAGDAFATKRPRTGTKVLTDGRLAA